MNVQDIYNTAIKRTYTSNANYLFDANFLVDLNKIYHEVCAEIRKMNENYFYDRFFFDTVPFQNKYVINGVSTNPPHPTASTRSIQKLLNVSIKLQQSQYDDFQTSFFYNKWDKILRSADGFTYTANADFTSWGSFVWSDWTQIYIGYKSVIEKSFTWFEIEGINFNNPNVFGTTFWNSYQNSIYIFGQDRDGANDLQNALYIYPYPTESIKQGIKIECVSTETDLLLTSVERDLMIERNYHEVLVEGIMYLIYWTQGKLQEAQMQEQRYNARLKWVLEDMTDRTQSPNYVTNSSTFLLE